MTCFKIIWQISSLLIFLELSTYGENIFVSKHNGRNVISCGRIDFPCETLHYAVLKSQAGNVTIKLDGGSRKLNKTLIYTMNKTILVNRNLSVDRYNEYFPLVTGTNSRNLFVFTVTSVNAVTLNIENIHFAEVSFVDFNNTRCSLNIVNCSFTSVSKVFSFSKENTHSISITASDCVFDAYHTIMYVRVKFTLHIDFNRCNFTNSNQTGEGFRIYVLQTITMTVELCHCLFQRTHSSLFISGRRSSPIKVQLSHCAFHENTGIGIIVFNCESIYVFKSLFTNNSYDGSGVFKLQSLKHIRFSQCRFVGNKGSHNGGAVSLNWNPDVSIHSSQFVKNNARLAGGAIENRKGHLYIKNCVFDKNYANAMGGAIFGDESKSSKITLKNVSLTSLDETGVVRSSLINTKSILMLEDVKLTITGNRNISYIDGVSKVVNDEGSIIRRTVFKCPSNNKIVLNIYQSNIFQLSCRSCRRGTYNLRYEYLRFIANITNYNWYTVPCYQCPPGGICDNYVMSRGNLWGYANKSQGTVKFLPCPPNYCCKPGTCQTYNGCFGYRHKTLCGSCHKDYTLNIFTHKCVRKSDCSIILFWLVFSISSVCIVLFVIFLKHLTSLPNAIVKKIPFKTKEVVVQNNDGHLDDDGDDETDELLMTRSKLAYNSNKNLGLTKLLFLFYQTASLIHVHRHSDVTVPALDRLDEFSNFIFSFSIYFNTELSSLCPNKEMGPIDAAIVNMLFVLSLFLVVVILFAVTMILTIVWKRSQKKTEIDNKFGLKRTSFSMRLKQTFIQLLLLCYIRIACFCFKMLNCVNIGYSKHLYIHGELKCYVWWQYLLLVFAVVWVLPFAGAVYVATNLYSNRKISNWSFFSILLMPPLSIFYKIKFSKQRSVHKKYELLNQENELLLNVVSGPFRQRCGFVESKRMDTKLNWEVPLIIQRLLLTVSSIFFINPIWKLLVITVILVVSILGHVFMKPFSSKRINIAALVSLSLQLLLAIINLFWAYDYMNDGRTMPGYHTIGGVLIYSEYVISSTPLVVLILFAFYKSVRAICKKCFNSQKQ